MDLEEVGAAGSLPAYWQWMVMAYPALP